MNKDLKKAMNLLKQEIKYTKTSESDSLTGIIVRFEELETVVKNCSIPDVTEEEDDYGFGSCPKCGSKKYVNVPKGENCDDCGYFVHYP